MERLLFTVEDSFVVGWRGMVLVPGISTDEGLRLKGGEALILKRPDGTELAIKLAAVGWFGSHAKPRGFPILVRAFDKREVPAGTTVWLQTELMSDDEEIEVASAPR